MPLRRAAALAGVNRTTAWRWENQGAAEIDQAPDDGEELSPHARFTLAFGQARAEYLAELTAAWKAAVKRKDHHVAKVIATMLASQSPDEYSERRAARSIDQRTTLTGEIGVNNRFAEMTTDDLHAERERIAERRVAAKIADGDDWRTAVADRPGPAEVDIDPAPAPAEKKPCAWEAR